MKSVLLVASLLFCFKINAQVPNLHWKYQDDGKSYQEDRGQCIAFDPSGNVITAGYVESGCTNIDIVVTKYSSTGDTLWSVTYDGSGTYGEEDYPNALAVDANGDIYVTGRTELAGFFYAVTIRYDANGNRIWANRYLTAQSTGNDIDVDSLGNVYICGYLETSNNKDFLVIKYNAAGMQQWLQSYSNGNYDEAVSLKVTNSGNVYVTGKQSGINFLFDWATIKYNTLGTQQWVDVFSNANSTYSEVPVDLEMDGAGFVYVTGSAPLSAVSNNDFYIIKYDPSGNRVWENSYHNPVLNGDEYPIDMAVDATGNVFITGNAIFTGSGQDITTVKFNASGQFVWAMHVDSIQQTDYARAIVVDNTGQNVFVTGDVTVANISGIDRDIVVIRYDSSGAMLDKRVVNGPGNGFDLSWDMAIDPSGMIGVAGMLTMNHSGNGNGDMATLVYNSLLTPKWTRTQNGDSFADDHGTDMVVDPSGYSYVCGYTNGGDVMFEDLVVFKVSPWGEKMWRYVYSGTEETSSEFGTHITIDGSGNVYVTGTTDTSAGTYYRDIYTAKLDSTGQLLWQQIYNGNVSLDDYPVGIAVDSSGNVYVGATTSNLNTGKDGTVICYDASGNQLWATNDDHGSQAEEFNTIILDKQQNVYAAGTFYPPSGALSDGWLAKFSPAGTVLWDTTYDYSLSNNDRDLFNSIALDDSGNVFVAGQSVAEFVTAKYDPTGQPVWIQHFSNSVNPDSATAIAIDHSGNVIVAGVFGQPIEGDFGFVKYNNNGTIMFSRRYVNPPGSDDILTDMAIDTANRIYLTGWETSNFTTNYNFLTVRYDSAGVFDYDLVYSDSLGVGPDYGKRIALDSIGNIYLMGDANENCLGNTFINGFRWNTQVLRYGPGIFTGVSTISSNQQQSLIYPNPATDAFTVKLPLNIFGDSPVELMFYDLSGRLLYNTTREPGAEYKIDTAGWQTGMVFYVARNRDSSKSGKIILTR
ncbi:MAG TPA: SBBP repeat-containing protein [Bacteroidia bacterium]|nr:SBBP repeat-containing protein [Bacteroidia bacterium]